MRRRLLFLMCLLCTVAYGATEGKSRVDLEKKGGLKGDVELLKQTAMVHRKNSKAIGTWQGKALIEKVSRDANGIQMQRKSSAQFFFNRELNATRWRWTTEEYLWRQDGRLVLDPNMATTLDAMIRGNAFCRYAHGITTREGKRLKTLVIFPAERARKIAYSDGFDPMWYLVESKYDLVEKLLFHYREARNPELIPGTVRRDGDLVILETKGIVALNRHEFDLSKGGNLVRYYAEGSRSVEHRALTYEKNAGVWVPKTFVFSFRKRGPDSKIKLNSRKVTFVKNIVNQPIDASEFSLRGLGVSCGDKVTDQRIKASFVYSEAEEQRLIEEFENMPRVLRNDELQMSEFMPSLVGKPLPSLDGFNIEYNARQTENAKILACFFDMNQRPSRHMVRELGKRVQELKGKGVAVVCVQASKVDRNTLDAWVKKHSIPFPVERIEGKEDQVLFNWGVRSLPWLILTDRKHVVTTEGFGIDELDEKIKAEEVTDLEFALTQTAQAAKRISSLSYNFRYEVDYYPEPDDQGRGPSHSVVSGQVLQQGVQRSTSWDMLRTWADRPDKGHICNRTVRNDDYFAFWHVGNDHAYQYDHESPTSMCPKAKEFLNSSSAPDYMAYAFGPYWNLKERYLKTVDKYQWKAERAAQADSSELFYVHMITPWMKVADQPEVTYVIDPQKGFLITRRFDYHTDGRLKTDVKVSVERFEADGDEIWLPVGIDEKKFHVRNVGSDEPNVGSLLRAELTDSKLNQPIDDEKFTLEALGLTNDIVLIKQTIAGELVVFIHRDGFFFPEDMVPESIVGKPLPAFEGLNLQLVPEQIKDKRVLVCFWDMNQRPSRHLLGELAKKAQELKGKGVAVVCVQASKIDKSQLDKWVKKYNIPFSVGMVGGDAEKMRFRWGVKALPWLILTDRKHIVRAEGFGLEELDEKTKGTP